MKIYDETTREEITNPDLSAGYLYDGVIVTGQTEELIQVMEGTVTDDRPNGLRRLIPAQNITEPCQWYHTYTEKELAVQNQTEVPSDIDSRLDFLESGQTDLQEALEMILTGVTE